MLRSVKLNSMNNRSVAIDPHDVLFLEEHTLDDKIVTNVHFGNGRWVTAVHPLNEVEALILPSKNDDEAEAKAEQDQLSRWRKMAKMRREAQLEIESELAKIGPKLKSKSYHKEVFPDGSGKLTITYEPDMVEAT